MYTTGGFGLMRRPLRWLIATAGASLAFAVLPPVALAGPAPTIESESVSHVSPTDATLEAQIDVENLEHGAYYQFQVVENTSEYLPELACPEPSVQLDGHDGCGIPGPGGGHPTPGALPIGFIPSNTMEPAKSASVSLDLAVGGMTLQPGTTYHYRVLAVERVQSEDTLDWVGPPVAGPDQTFTTPPSTAPVIDSVSVSHLTPTDATLEATINTEGQSTLYAFQLTYTRCHLCEDLEPTYLITLPIGLLLGSFQDQSVSLDLNSAGVTLKPGFYEYSLIATSLEGDKAEAPWQSFEPPLGVLDPPGLTVTPGPVSNEPEVPLAGGQYSTSGGNNSSAPADGSVAVSSKPAHGKPSTKHGKRRKHMHHGKGHKRKH
ncbi:MAG: hypothetical protein ACHQE6_11670 [Solirubrobacterales bacterium]